MTGKTDPDASTEQPRWEAAVDDTIAGVTVFLTIGYVAFLTPILLSTIGAPTYPVFFATCLVAAVGSFVAGVYGRVPNVIAPGVAFSGFIGGFAPQHGLPWESVFIICASSGVVFFFLSVRGLRSALIEAIPSEIRAAIAAGIGGLLIDNALKEVRRKVVLCGDEGLQGRDLSAMKSPPAGVCANGQTAYETRESLLDAFTIDNDLAWLFVTGVGTILGFFILVRRWAFQLEQRGRKVSARILDLIGRASLLGSIGLVAFLAAKWDVETLSAPVLEGGFFIWDSTELGLRDALTGAFNLAGVSLGLIILYLMLADFVGTPWQTEDKLPSLAENANQTERPNLRAGGRDDRIRRAFYVDSAANMASFLLALSPVVYFAENVAAKAARGRRGLVAVVAALGFVGLLVLEPLIRHSAGGWLPTITTAPVLFFVGLLIVAGGLLETSNITVPGRTNPKSRLELTGSIEKRLPAAATIVLTPIVGLSYSLAAGLVVYLLHFAFLPQEERERLDIEHGQYFWHMVWLAGVALALSLLA